MLRTIYIIILMFHDSIHSNTMLLCLIIDLVGVVVVVVVVPSLLILSYVFT